MAYHLKRTWNRRQLLRLAPAAGAGLLGLALGACSPSGPVASQATPNAAPGQSGAIPTGWDQLVAAAQKEGKGVVSGPAAADGRTKRPAGCKDRSNIELEALAANSS